MTSVSEITIIAKHRNDVRGKEKTNLKLYIYLRDQLSRGITLEKRIQQENSFNTYGYHTAAVYLGMGNQHFDMTFSESCDLIG